MLKCEKLSLNLSILSGALQSYNNYPDILTVCDEQKQDKYYLSGDIGGINFALSSLT